MIYLVLFWEFFKTGLFAIGGGLVTLPFLFDMADRYPWFTRKELADMIAISESTPGPIGVNMATYAGFHAAGFSGGLIATVGLVLPSLIIIMLIAKFLKKYQRNYKVQTVLAGIRPAVLALILFAGLQIAQISITDILSAVLFGVFWAMIHFWKRSPIIYLGLAAVVGILLQI